MARRDDDEAPWLAEVESDGHGATLVERGRLIGGVTLFVLLLLLVVIGVYVITQTKQDGATGTPVARAEDAPLIAADPGPYKVVPANPGGLEVDTGMQAANCARTGHCPGPESLNGNLPEEPGPRPGEEPVALLPDGEALPAIPPPAPQAAAVTAAPAAPVVAPPVTQLPAKPPAKPKPGAAATAPVIKAPLTTAPPKVAVVPAPVPASGGTVLQLGAFSSAANAEAAWKSLSGRFGYLAGLNKRIEPIERDTGTLYRLRASGSADAATAAATCARLKAAGESCAVVK